MSLRVSFVVAVFFLVACGTGAESEVMIDEPSLGVVDEATTAQSELIGAPTMRVPFPCDQVWTAETRANHSPVLAVDFNRPNDLGDTVVSSAPGVVTRSESEGSVSYGNWVEIDHGSGYRTRYAHLSVRSVRVGQRVGQAQKIGEVGSTGDSSGPHLHYEQLHNGSNIRVVLGGTPVVYFETRDYRSHNGCAP